MDAKLEEIGTLTTGIYKKGSPSGDTYYLQAKHFDAYGKFQEEGILHPEIFMDNKLAKHSLKDGDLLITAKGENNRVCLYRSEIGQAVASSIFFVFRLKVSIILPEYLQWYFNTSRMQRLFSSLSRGTHILSLSKKSLSKVQIKIPTLEKQREVLKLQLLWDQERKITTELLEQKEICYQSIFLNLVTSKEI